MQITYTSSNGRMRSSITISFALCFGAIKNIASSCRREDTSRKLQTVCSTLASLKHDLSLTPKLYASGAVYSTESAYSKSISTFKLKLNATYVAYKTPTPNAENAHHWLSVNVEKNTKNNRNMSQCKKRRTWPMEVLPPGCLQDKV